MTKDEFITKVANETGQSKAQVNRTVKATLDTITETLKKGDKITFVGFGTFMTSKRAARMGRNPQTGDKMKIKASKVAKFRPGKVLRESVRK